jgi:hypothetical protein
MNGENAATNRRTPEFVEPANGVIVMKLEC